MNLFAVFNERDPERRLKAITANYTEDVIWTDPERTFHGREELNQRAQDLLDTLPDLVFTAAGPVDVYWAISATCRSSTDWLSSRPLSPATTSTLVRDRRIAVLYTLVNTGG